MRGKGKEERPAKHKCKSPEGSFVLLLLFLIPGLFLKTFQTIYIEPALRAQLYADLEGKQRKREAHLLPPAAGHHQQDVKCVEWMQKA